MKKVEIYNGIVVEHIFPDKKLDIERLVRELSILATEIYRENNKQDIE